jgi:hypothetical protein
MIFNKTLSFFCFDCLVSLCRWFILQCLSVDVPRSTYESQWVGVIKSEWNHRATVTTHRKTHSTRMFTYAVSDTTSSSTTYTSHHITSHWTNESNQQTKSLTYLDTRPSHWITHNLWRFSFFTNYSNLTDFCCSFVMWLSSTLSDYSDSTS